LALERATREKAAMRLSSLPGLTLLTLLTVAPLAPASPWLGASVAEAADCTVYVTRTGHSYHRAGCSSLSHSSIQTTRSEAVAHGYAACKRCGGSDCEPAHVSGSASDSLRQPAPPGAKDCTVYVTKSGARYHKAGCSSLHGGGTQMTRSAARANGLTPCKHCGGSTCDG
jgi:hypothetical protein